MSINWPASSPTRLKDEALEAEVTGMLAGMSLEQKVGQMIQPDIRYITPAEVAEFCIGTVLSGGGAPPNNDAYASVPDWLQLADELYEASLASGAPVPVAWGIDALHGHNNLHGATLFPHNIGLGATRNPELVRQIARVTAVEVAATGLDWTFAPTLAVARDDRWGRTYESFSESSELVTSFTAAAIEGLQGVVGSQDFLVHPAIIATAKHYLGDGGSEHGIDQGDTICDEETLRDMHGIPYSAAIAAGVQTVMASFSSWCGDKLHGHHYLLQQVLKDQMGFDGFVISDWNGHGQLSTLSNVHGHEAINAGIDMLMAPEDWHGLLHNTVEQVCSGVISEARIDDAVTRILRVKLRAGLRFPNKPSARALAGDVSVVGCHSHRELARQAVRESAVLLKNNNAILPLRRDAKVLVTGSGADDVPMQCGGWSLTWQGDDVTSKDFPGATSVFDAVQGALSESGGCAEFDLNPQQLDDIDVALVVFGETPYAEGHGDREHLSHSSSRPEDLALLQRLKAQGIPVVSVLLSGRPLWVNPELNASDAFIAAWLPGTEAAGIADLLFSVESLDFVGKLPFSWPAAPDQTDLNVGDSDYHPLFAFGYGLSLSDAVHLNDDLDETDVTVVSAPDQVLNIFDLRPVAPFKLYVGDHGDWRMAVEGRNFYSRNEIVEVQVVDWRRQEDARRITWSGGSGQCFFWSENSIDCSRLIVPGSVLRLSLCIHKLPQSRVMLRQDSLYPRGAEVEITALLQELEIDRWQSVDIDLAAFISAGLQTKHVTTPFLIWTDGELELSIGAVSLLAADGVTKTSAAADSEQMPEPADTVPGGR